MFYTTELDERSLWGLVLAAGDGKRLQSYVQQIKGKDLAKQFINIVGQRSMLEHTFGRAEKLIPADQIFTIISKHHLEHAEVRRQLSNRLEETLIVQPLNKETGPGILLPIMFLFKQRPDAIVALFPSDHFILDEDRFMRYARLAAEAVRCDPSRIVLLAMEAQAPETEYGYILPGEPIGGFRRFGIRMVSRFFEKPAAYLAHELTRAGGLWNTMTMIFEVKTLLNLVSMVQPFLYRQFCKILAAIGTPQEDQVIEEVYQNLEPINFSKGIIEKIAAQHPDSIAVLPVQRVYWSDWGSPQRIHKDLRVLARTKSYKVPLADDVPIPWPYKETAKGGRVWAAI